MDTWIEWNGGRIPVAWQMVVEVRLRDGSRCTTQAGALYWEHRFGQGDVVAYRLAGPGK